VQRAPGVPHALFGRKIQQRLGASRREGACVWILRFAACGAAEAIHSFFARQDGLLRFARNDGLKARDKGSFRTRRAASEKTCTGPRSGVVAGCGDQLIIAGQRERLLARTHNRFQGFVRGDIELAVAIRTPSPPAAMKSRE